MFQRGRRDGFGAGAASKCFFAPTEAALAAAKGKAACEADLQPAVEGGPAAKSLDKVAFRLPGLTAIIRRWFARQLWLPSALFIARVAAAADPAAASDIGSKRLDGVESLSHFLQADILYQGRGEDVVAFEPGRLANLVRQGGVQSLV